MLEQTSAMVGRHKTWNIWIEKLLGTMKRVIEKRKYEHKIYTVGVKRKENYGIKHSGAKIAAEKEPVCARGIKIPGGEKRKNDDFFFVCLHC